MNEHECEQSSFPTNLWIARVDRSITRPLERSLACLFVCMFGMPVCVCLSRSLPLPLVQRLPLPVSMSLSLVLCLSVSRHPSGLQACPSGRPMSPVHRIHVIIELIMINQLIFELKHLRVSETINCLSSRAAKCARRIWSGVNNQLML